MMDLEVRIVNEQFFKVNIVKDPYRNQLDDERFESCLRVAASQISPHHIQFSDE